MPLLTRRTIGLAKIEATYGTDPVPTGSANAILLRNVNLQPMQSTPVNRDLIRPYLGNSEQLPDAVYSMVDFEVEVAGAGAAGTAPKYGPLLRACGLSETITAGTDVVYAPVSTGFESVTLYFNADGVLHKFLGARGTVAIDLNTKAIPVYRFRFQAFYTTPTDAAAPTPDFTGWQRPLTVNNQNTVNFSLHGASAPASQVSLDIANTLVFRSLIGGQEANLITDRRGAGQVTFEATLVATKDWWTPVRLSTTGALSIQQGTTAGNIVTFDSPSVSLGNPTYSDLDGIRMMQCPLTLIPTSAGNNELSITVK